MPIYNPQNLGVLCQDMAASPPPSPGALSYTVKCTVNACGYTNPHIQAPSSLSTLPCLYRSSLLVCPPTTWYPPQEKSSCEPWEQAQVCSHWELSQIPKELPRSGEGRLQGATKTPGGPEDKIEPPNTQPNTEVPLPGL